MRPRVVCSQPFQASIWLFLSLAALVSPIASRAESLFAAPYLYAVGGPAIAVGDMDSDGKQDLVSPSANGVALGDLDGDGRLDIAKVGGRGLDVSLSSHSSASYPLDAYLDANSVSIGDLNMDGVPDLAVTGSFSDNISLLLGIGNGSFAPPVVMAAASNRFPTYVAIGDLNADGRNDLAIAYQNGGVSLWLGGGDGSFSTRLELEAPSAKKVVIADMNSDGNEDLVAAGTVLFGNGDGTFASPIIAASSGTWSSVGDLNGDGILDVVVTGWDGGYGNTQVSVSLGIGGGEFGPQMTFPTGDPSAPDHGDYPHAVEIIDLDSDGINDLAISINFQGTINILNGHGDGTFGWSRPIDVRQSVAIADLNADGHLDLVSPSQVLFGDGSGEFPTSTPLGTNGRSVAVGEITPDGTPIAVGSGTVTAVLVGLDGTVHPLGTILCDFVWGLAIGDLNADGHPDLVVASDPGLSVFLGMGNGLFGPGNDLGIFADDVIIFDINGDNIPDLVTAGPDFLGVGDGTFLPATGGFPSPTSIGANQSGMKLARKGGVFASSVRLAVCDLNGDGVFDKVGMGWAAIGNGDGTFRDSGRFGLGPGASGIAVLDANLDGNLDVAAVCTDQNIVPVALGRGDGTFDAQASYGDLGHWNRVIKAGDLNEDGRSDLVVAGFDGIGTILLGTSDRPPGVTAPSSIEAKEGSEVTFSVYASDPDASSIASLVAAPLPVGATFSSNAAHTVGTLTWTPDFTQAGTYPLTFTASNVRTGLATTVITVTNLNRMPVAEANGPYFGVAGLAVSFDGGGSADADGDALTYAWDFGDGTSGSGPSSVHAYPVGGSYDVTLTVTDAGTPPLSGTAKTTASISQGLEARVSISGGNKSIKLNSGKPTWCATIEPVNGSFGANEVDLASLILRYGGERILAIAGKTSQVSDQDHDGIQDIGVCFAKDQLRALFADLPGGRSIVTVTIEGLLLSGAQIGGSTEVEVVSSGAGLAASLSPNPFNPSAVLTFATRKDGPLRVRLFDATGRLVRTLLDLAQSPAGYHDVRVEARDSGGRHLASGVYLYRVDSVEGSIVGRALILK